jgi:predicted RNA methylase
MAKQRDIAGLRDAVKSTAFTPSARDLTPLVELLGDEDEAVVRGTERAIVRAASGGAVVVAPLLGLLAGAPPGVRAQGFRVVGRLMPTDRESAAVLIAALADADARVQKSAANALGRLERSEAGPDIAQALLAAWDEVPELPLARALAEAMGKRGVAEALARLEAVTEGDPELVRIAKNAVAMLRRDGTRQGASVIDGARAGDFDVRLVVLCRGGVEGLAAGELTERVKGARDVRAGAIGSGRVTATWRGAPRDLFAVRTMLGFAFALPDEPIAGAVDDASVEEATARALTSDVAARILETWTAGVVRYRLDWDGKGHRRASTWRVVHALGERRPAWVNDPTESTWQATVSVSVADGVLRVLLAPRKLEDPRFTYRLKDVPAASHPTLAAALVRASRPKADDVVWDPFVGSGSELVERARAGACARLVGSDLDPAALEAARANLAAAALDGVTLDLADATTHAPAGVTCIVTNPPMGRRVARDGSLGDLLDRFVDQAARVLTPGGRLVWLSPLGGQTAARAEANGLRVASRQSVDMGGFHAELQVAEKPVR